MFEKEAEEYAVLNARQYIHNEDIGFCTSEDEVRQAYQKGAEFGYNKANEWHYMKDRLPKTSGRYLVYTGGEPFILDFDTEVNSFGYWVASLGDDWGVRDEDFETVKDRGEDEVIAWKEIVLPKESEK